MTMWLHHQIISGKLFAKQMFAVRQTRANLAREFAVLRKSGNRIPYKSKFEHHHREMNIEFNLTSHDN